MGAFLSAERAQARQNVSQSKIVVHLLAELLLAQLVQHEEFPRQEHILFEAARREFHPHYNLDERKVECVMLNV